MVQGQGLGMWSAGIQGLGFKFGISYTGVQGLGAKVEGCRANCARFGL